MGKIQEALESDIFESFFKSSHEAMFISTRDGHFLDVNQAFGSILGYERLELIGANVSLILDNQQDRLHYQNTIEGRGVVHQFPLVFRHKNGSSLPCVIDAIKWGNSAGQSGYHGLIRTKNDLANTFNKFFGQLKKERELLQEQRKNIVQDTKILTRHFSDELIAQMDKSGKNLLKAERKRVTILFFDIRNSTRMGESLEPEVFAQLLSDIFTDIIDLIYGCKGHVNKLLGDGIMATFGAPTGGENDAFNAVDAALRIRSYLETFNDVRPDYLQSDLEAGIGIATGEVFAGLIGSVRRQEYTVIGNAVNVASRLEKLTKRLKDKILFDEASYQRVRDHFKTRKVYQGLIRGKTEELSIYTVDEAN